MVLPIPNVPGSLPGVPPLPGGGIVVIPPVLAIADAVGLSVFGPQQWGIFNQDGSPVLVADSVYSIDYNREYHVSDYPQEQGSFESYNKVLLPFTGKVTFLIAEDRVEFLQSVEAAVASLDLVSVITPEISYPSANLTKYSYRREARAGVTLIRVDVGVEEIRQTATATLSQSAQQSAATAPNPSPTTSGILNNTQSPNGTATQQNGVEQPITPPSSEPWVVNMSPQ